MLQAALRSGAAQRRCVFEVFARRLPEGRRYGVVAGTGRLLEAVAPFRFGADELAALRERGVVDERRWTSWPATASPATSAATPRASATSPGRRSSWSRPPSPRAVLLETLILSILNHDAAVAAAASRMVAAAGDRPCLEMGSRRTHEEAAVAAARAAYVAGFAATSNLEAGRTVRRADRRHERARVHPAARHRARRVRGAGRPAWARARPCWSTPTTCRTAVEVAVDVAGPELGAVRLDSGDLRHPGRRGPRAAGRPGRHRAPGSW